MIPIEIKPDFLNSALSAFYYTVFPNEIKIRHNRDLFEKYTITEQEKEFLTAYFQKITFGKVDLNDKEAMNHYGISRMFNHRFADLSLDDLESKISRDIFGPEGKIFIDLFISYAKGFKEHYDKICKDAGDLSVLEAYLTEKYPVAIKFIEDTYKVSLSLPKSVEYHLIESIAPNASGKRVGDVAHVFQGFPVSGKPYENIFLSGLIHETIGHRMVSHLRSRFYDILDVKASDWVSRYFVEEGFVKEMSNSTTNAITTGFSNGSYGSELDLLSQQIFRMRMPLLKEKDFDSWYLDTIREITSRI